MLLGSCLCKAVQYQITGDLGAAMMCHCQNCRKASGTAFAANVLVNTKDFNLVTGQELIAEFESSPGVYRSFCQQCGSPLYSRRSAIPDSIRLKLGSLDSQVDIKPEAHIFVDSKAEWDTICDDIPQFPQRPK
jgi:hypothetical protein